MEVQSQVLVAYSLAARQEPGASATAFRRLAGPDGPLGEVTATCFLLSVADFVHQDLCRLLAQLQRTTQVRRVALRGGVRGNVDWGTTLKARNGSAEDSSVFVCRESRRLFDLPENRLLRFLLEQLRRYQERVPEALRGWSNAPPFIEADPASLDPPEGPLPTTAGDHLALMAHRIRSFSRSAYLRNVELRPTLEPEALRAARSSKNPLYNRLAQFHLRCQEVVEQPRWEAWSEVIRSQAGLLPMAETRYLSETLSPPSRPGSGRSSAEPIDG